MDNRSYWLDVFTQKSWQEFLDTEGNISAFKDDRWITVQNIQPGDYLLCYIKDISGWVGILEVISEPFKEETIFKLDDFTSKVEVKIVKMLDIEKAVPALSLGNKLTMFKSLKNPNRWRMLFKGSPRKINQHDALEIVKAIHNL